GFDDSFRQGKPETGAALLAAVRPPESIEDLREMLRIDAWTVVGYGDSHAVPMPIDGDVDTPAGFDESQRIADQVRQHLHDPRPIEPHARQTFGNRALEPYALLVGADREQHDRFVEQRA